MAAMSVIAARPPIARPDVPDLTRRARAIADLARERVQQTEADRRVSDDMVEQMRQADLLRVMQPQAFGGFEYGFDVFFELTAAIAAGCGSTGWVYGLLASHQWLVACFSREAQEEVWRDPDATATGSYAPVGQAVAVDGGYRLTGTGSFCSGCDNAQWQLLGGMIPQADGTVKPGFFLMPTSDCSIDDNWHTMGLAGTGSKNIVARDVFVPAHRALPFADLANATAPGMHGNPNPLYRQSFLAVLPIAIVSPVLGMAEGALTEFLTMVGGRTTRGAVAGGNRRMAELTTVQLRVAEASALIDAARLLIERDLTAAFTTAARGEPISIDMRLRNRRDQAFCVRLLIQAIDALFLAAGGQGLFLDKPLQRFWRDAHAAASHISLNWDSTGSMYGQSMLGLEPKGQY
jgi:alkylation response protein AidB-like acyl-CoA dehydrogenase